MCTKSMLAVDGWLSLTTVFEWCIGVIGCFAEVKVAQLKNCWLHPCGTAHSTTGCNTKPTLSSHASPPRKQPPPTSCQHTAPSDTPKLCKASCCLFSASNCYLVVFLGMTNRYTPSANTATSPSCKHKRWQQVCTQQEKGQPLSTMRPLRCASH